MQVIADITYHAESSSSSSAGSGGQQIIGSSIPCSSADSELRIPSVRRVLTAFAKAFSAILVASSGKSGRGLIFSGARTRYVEDSADEGSEEMAEAGNSR